MINKNFDKYANKLVHAFLNNKIISPLPTKYTKKLSEAQKFRKLCESKIKKPIAGFKAAGTGISVLKKLKEKELAMNDHKQELAGHKNQLDAMKKMVAAMKSDHSESIAEEKRKSEQALRNLELQVEAETNSLVDELEEVERARRLSTSMKMKALSADELKAHASKIA